MNNKTGFQTLTQTIGLFTLVALALYGLLSLLGYDTPFAAAQGEARTASAVTTIPASFNYQGMLRLQNGTPIDGTRDIVARLWDDPVNGTTVYTETFDNVNVREGQFNIVLGDAPNSADALLSAFEAAPLYLELTVDTVVQLPRERLHAVPWALYSLNGGVPVGGVMDWMPPAADTPLPTGFLVCNGQIVNDLLSPFNGMALPNFDQKFARGTTNQAMAGQIGGNTSTGSAGEHNHQSRIWTGGALTDGAGNQLSASTYSFVNGGAIITFYAPGVPVTEHTDSMGAHTHTFDPPHILTLKLCRVR